MKMAKASEADLRMAMDLANVLDDIGRGYFPSKFSDDEDDGIEWIDTRNREQYERLVYSLKLLLNQGSISRVIWGMAVVCDPENEAIDPVADTIELHPKRLQLEKQRDELLVALEETRRELDACQKVIWLASDYGFDPAYVNGAKAAIKVADAALSSVKGQQ